MPVPFFLAESAMVADNWSEVAVLIVLRDNPADRPAGGIGFQDRKFVVVESAEENLFLDPALDFVESVLMMFFPREGYIFFEEVIERFHGVSEVWDELSVEVHESVESLQVPFRFWGFGIADFILFFGTHGHAFSGNDVIPEKVHFRLKPPAFLRFEMETFFLEGLEDYRAVAEVFFL